MAALVSMTGKAIAAQCGSTAVGFETWKKQFAGEAQARGVSASTIGAMLIAARSSQDFVCCLRATSRASHPHNLSCGVSEVAKVFSGMPEGGRLPFHGLGDGF